MFGGRVTKSSGPNVIDTGSGPGSTGVSWWAGVHSEDSLGTNGRNFESYGVRTVWMEDCTERGDSGLPVRIGEAGTVLRSGPNGVRGYSPDTGGLNVDYDPLNPV